jgi:hypothetical protein
MTTISQSTSGPRDARRSPERTVTMIEDGSACGSLDASTFLMLVYSDESGIHFFEKWYCCGQVDGWNDLRFRGPYS